MHFEGFLSLMTGLLLIIIAVLAVIFRGDYVDGILSSSAFISIFGLIFIIGGAGAMMDAKKDDKADEKDKD